MGKYFVFYHFVWCVVTKSLTYTSVQKQGLQSDKLTYNWLDREERWKLICTGFHSCSKNGTIWQTLDEVSEVGTVTLCIRTQSKVGVGSPSVDRTRPFLRFLLNDRKLIFRCKVFTNEVHKVDTYKERFILMSKTINRVTCNLPSQKPLQSLYVLYIYPILFKIFRFLRSSYTEILLTRTEFRFSSSLLRTCVGRVIYLPIDLGR